MKKKGKKNVYYFSFLFRKHFVNLVKKIENKSYYFGLGKPNLSRIPQKVVLT